jgi:hypothetical protein
VEEDTNTIFTMLCYKGLNDKYGGNIRNLIESKRGMVCSVHFIVIKKRY